MEWQRRDLVLCCGTIRRFWQHSTTNRCRLRRKGDNILAFIPVENVAQFRMQFTYDGENCENVYHVLNPSGWDADQLDIMAGGFVSWWDTTLSAFAPGTLVLQRVIGRDLTTESSAAIEYTTGLPMSGENASPQLPNNVTLAVKWTTGLAGRSFRGRTYHLGMPENSTVGNTVSGGPMADLLAAYFALTGVPSATIGGCLLVVVSLVHAGVPRTEGVATEIIGRSIDPTIDSQRRRLPGRGS